MSNFKQVVADEISRLLKVVIEGYDTNLCATTLRNDAKIEDALAAAAVTSNTKLEEALSAVAVEFNTKLEEALSAAAVEFNTKHDAALVAAGADFDSKLKAEQFVAAFKIATLSHEVERRKVKEEEERGRRKTAESRFIDVNVALYPLQVENEKLKKAIERLKASRVSPPSAAAADDAEP